MILFDGAMGTMLYKSGMKKGENTEIFGIENKDKLFDIHKQYLEAGADIITANTFGATDVNLSNTKYTVEEVVDKAIKIAKEAIKPYKNRYVALDVGPTGKMLEPVGDMTKDKLYEIYKKQIVQGEKSGADLILIETMMDLREAEIAVKVAKENTKLPVICSMTFGENKKSYMGDSPEDFVKSMEELKIDAVGINCSVEPKQSSEIAFIMKNITELPIIVQSNAGLPEIINGEAVYSIDKTEFASEVRKMIKSGISIIGGCCGTTPEYIKEIYKMKN